MDWKIIVLSLLLLFYFCVTRSTASTAVGNERNQDEPKGELESIGVTEEAVEAEEETDNQTLSPEPETDTLGLNVPVFQVESQSASNDVFIAGCNCGGAGEPAPNPFGIWAPPPVAREFSDIPDLQNPEPLIIGGGLAGEKEFPWIVGLSKRRFHDPADSPPRITCGATLINSKYLLTAAHCIHHELPFRYELLFKAHNLTRVATREATEVIKAKAKKFITHPQWDFKKVKNDIGLIELEKPIDFKTERYIRPACLPTPNDGDFTGQNGTAVGWGYTHPKGQMADILQKVVVPVWSNSDCMNKTRYGTMVTPTMVCAGFQEGKRDACTNDSGGPLTVTSLGGHKIVGIVSWGFGCANKDAPGVYTRVTGYLSWIRSVVKGSEWCKPK